MMTCSLTPIRRPAQLILMAVLAALWASPRARADPRSATLEAIHCLENPFDRAAPGPCGELGAYQFRSAVWRRYTTEPFANALDRRASDRVAVRHYEWLKRELVRRGYPANAYNVALAWNGGLGAVVGGRPCRAARDYAERAANLAADFDR